MQRQTISFSVITGVKASFLYKAQSSWVDPLALEAVAHSGKQKSSPFRSTAVATTLAFDFTYEFIPGWSFHLMPRGDLFLNSIYKRNTGIAQKPYSINLDVGLSFNF